MRLCLSVTDSFTGQSEEHQGRPFKIESTLRSFTQDQINPAEGQAQERVRHRPVQAFPSPDRLTSTSSGRSYRSCKHGR